MNRSLAILLFVVAGLLSVPAQAAPVTIDFEDQVSGTPGPLTIDGFTFSNGEIADISGDKKFFATSTNACNPFQCGPLTIDLWRDDGGLPVEW